MNQGTGQTMSAEWRRHWYVPAAAAIGYSMFGLQTYAIGPFVIPLEKEFGWSRATVMAGLTLSNMVGIFVNIGIGALVDRLGPRRVGLAGLLAKAATFGLLGAATGTLLNWSALWFLVALGAMLSNSQVWTAGVASRFDKGRGLALALALSGTSICGAIAPLLGTALIEAYGWRMAFPGLALAWLAVSLPMVFFLFHNTNERKAAASPVAEVRDVPGMSLREGLRSSIYWRLLFAAFAYAAYTVALAPNLVPLLVEKGSDPMGAAGIASIVGVLAIVSRLAAGFLLDWLPSHLVGAAIFLLPVAGCVIMLADHPPLALQIVAVVSLGITIGAEFDVIVYLTARHFGTRSFGALFGGMITTGALGGALGPIGAGWIHDQYHNYDPLLVLLAAVMAISSVFILSIGRGASDREQTTGAT
ncbi:MAG: MFS transporter [Novosphingobium sp.]